MRLQYQLQRKILQISQRSDATNTGLQQAAHNQVRKTLLQEGWRHKQVRERAYTWTYSTAPDSVAPLEQLSSA